MYGGPTDGHLDPSGGRRSWNGLVRRTPERSSPVYPRSVLRSEPPFRVTGRRGRNRESRLHRHYNTLTRSVPKLEYRVSDIRSPVRCVLIQRVPCPRLYLSSSVLRMIFYDNPSYRQPTSPFFVLIRLPLPL